MNELKVIYKQEVLERDFKVYGTLDEPLFLAKDVAEWIEHSNVSKMLNNIDEDEKKLIELSTLTNGYSRKEANLTSSKWFLTEDGLYEVLMQSRKPIAKQFKKQVKKILKQIRKTGKYDIDSPSYAIEDPIKRAEKWIEEQKEKMKLETTLEKQKPLVTVGKKVIAKDWYTCTTMARRAGYKERDTAKFVTKLLIDAKVLSSRKIDGKHQANKGFSHLFEYFPFEKDGEVVSYTLKGTDEAVTLVMSLLEYKNNVDEMKRIAKLYKQEGDESEEINVNEKGYKRNSKELTPSYITLDELEQREEQMNFEDLD